MQPAVAVDLQMRHADRSSMKKLSPRFARWLLHRQKVSLHSHRSGRRRRRSVQDTRVVLAWDGQEEIRIKILRDPIRPEQRLCLDTNYWRTADFLGKWQERVFASAWSCRRSGSWTNPGPVGKLPTMTSFYDFSLIKEVSTAASVVIAAEYERARLIVGAPPPAINLDKWSATAFSKLYGMGFFEAVGLSDARAARFTDREGVVTMQILSGSSGDQLAAAGKALEDLLSDTLSSNRAGFDIKLEELLFWINTAVSEALTNVSNWAYNDLSRGGPQRWWVAATLAPLTNNLTVVVYDQGLTIPKSLGSRIWYHDMVTKISALWRGIGKGDDWDESQWIAAALEYRRSRSRLDHRGKGLPQMVDILDHCPDGSLRIVSGAGSCYIAKGCEVVEEAQLRNPIRGTLIEWKLSLPVQT